MENRYKNNTDHSEHPKTPSLADKHIFVFYVYVGHIDNANSEDINFYVNQFKKDYDTLSKYSDAHTIFLPTIDITKQGVFKIF